MNKKIFGISVILLAVLLGGIFVYKGKDSEVEQTSDIDKQIKIEHSLGEVSLEEVPKRVVVFDYGVLDCLQALGVDVIGLPKDGSLPEYLDEFSDEKYTSVGSIKEPDLEKVYELKPDVIFISGRMTDYYEKLSEIAPTIFIENNGNDYITSFTENVSMYGEIFNKEEKAKKLVNTINKKVKEVNTRVKEANVNASLVMVNGRNISAFGSESRFGLLFNELGFKEADDELQQSTHGQEVSFEYLIKTNPNYLFVVDRNSITNSEEISAKEVIENEIVKSTDAYKDGNIVYLNSVNWYTVSGGYTSTLNMINEVAKVIK